MKANQLGSMLSMAKRSMANLKVITLMREREGERESEREKEEIEIEKELERKKKGENVR